MTFEANLNYLKEIEQSGMYKPNSQRASELRPRIIIPLVGPTAVGKSTIGEAAARLNPEKFACVSELTTRRLRPGEAEAGWRELPHNTEGLQEIIEKVEAGELVQYVVHPTNRIYATEPRDYPARFNILPTLYSDVEAMQKLPFEDCVPVGLVAAPNDWQPWHNKRRKAAQNPQDELERLHEADQCVEWLLAHKFPLVWNRPGHIEQTAQEIIDIAHGTYEPDARAQRIGQQLLVHIKLLLYEKGEHYE